MKTISEEKVKGGKLIRIKTDFDEHSKKINSVQITGDFFFHPENKILLIEKYFFEKNADFKVESAVEELDSIVKNNSIEMIGIDIVTIVKLVKKSLM